MLHFLLLFAITLLAFSPMVLSQVQDDDPVDSYDPDSVHYPSMNAQSLSVIPMTDGWEYVSSLTGRGSSGDTWESQVPSWGTLGDMFRNPSQWHLRTSSPQQEVSISFVGKVLRLSCYMNNLDYRNMRNYPLRALEAPPSTDTTWETAEDSGNDIMLDFTMILPTDTYYNITFRTSTDLPSNLTIFLIRWETDMMTRK